MKTTRLLTFSMLLLVLFAVTSRECRADSFIITHNTSPLVGSGTFTLNFQFNGTAGNTATIGSFNLFGGSLTGSPAVIGFAGMDGAGTVTLTSAPAGFFNAFSQTFTPGMTLQFVLTLTANVTPTPDMFSFAILDENGLELPTFGPAFEFLSIEITAPFTIQSYAGDPLGGGPVLDAPTVTSVPEPATMVLFGTGLMLVASTIRKRRGTGAD